MFRILNVMGLALSAFGMSLLLITAGSIVIGAGKKHIAEPIYQRYFVPPLYVDDPRCCR